MKINQIVKSQEDKSVNFIADNKVEARYVRRIQDYFIVYLSSHNGCNKACRFCHLTQTKQTDFEHVTVAQYLEQADIVLKYYQEEAKLEQGAANRVNFNFMARGEPLANKYLLNDAKTLFRELKDRASALGLEHQINISSILPEELNNTSLEKVFDGIEENHMLYYSLYSLDPNFRKRWIPKSISPDEGFKQLKSWQGDNPNRDVAFHWAFIKGENDSEEQVRAIVDKIKDYDLRAKFNLVRYNPFSDNQGVESDESTNQRNFKILQEALNHKDSRIVPRVGFDVKASCGMFVND